MHDYNFMTEGDKQKISKFIATYKEVLDRLLEGYPEEQRNLEHLLKLSAPSQEAHGKDGKQEEN